MATSYQFNIVFTASIAIKAIFISLLIQPSLSMYQKDYILRMIELIMKFIGEVLGLIDKGELHKAAKELEEGYHIFLKEDAVFFRHIPEEKLTQVLLEEHNYTNGHLEMLAELFNAEAVLDLAQGGRQESLEYSRKALLLFEFVDKEQKTYSAERLNKIKAIRNRIEGLS
jgi:hypothetical protein